MRGLNSIEKVHFGPRRRLLLLRDGVQPGLQLLERMLVFLARGSLGGALESAKRISGGVSEQRAQQDSSQPSPTDPDAPTTGTCAAAVVSAHRGVPVVVRADASAPVAANASKWRSPE